MKRIRKAVMYVMAAVMMASVCLPAMPVSAATKIFEIGKQDPKEVVATVDSAAKTVTLSMDYVYSPDGGAEELPNPGYMTDQRQTALLDYMDMNNLTGYTLIIEDGVKGIGTNAFTGTAAFSAITNNSSVLEKIGENAFSSMSQLTTADLGNAVITTIAANTFADTPLLTSIEIPASVSTIETGAFQNSGIENVSGGAGVRTLGADAFSGAKKIVLDTTNDTLIGYDWPGHGYTEMSMGDGTKIHIVDFSTGLGSVTVEQQLVKDGELAQEPTVSDANNTFEGWFSDAAFANLFDFQTGITANTTIYGKWHSNTVTITFDAQNGTTNTTQSIAYGGKVEKPTDPMYGDKVFVGWFKDSGFVTPVDFANDVFDKDTTLYAKYVDATYFTVTFEVNGGTAVDKQSIKAGKTVLRPTDPTKDDYTFDGWYTSNEYKTAWDFDKNTVSADTKLYAKWKSNFVTVKFETNGGGIIESQIIERGTTAKRPSDPSKDNCEFLGWFTDSGASNAFNFDSKVNEDITVYAGWNQTAFTVKFESNGGTAVASVTANPNTLIAKPADPTKEGYHLEAWCSDSGLTTAWDFNSSQVTGDITLYAKWAPGSAPGVTNTGAAVPQTGDPTSAAATAGSLLTTVGAALVGKKKKWF